jgi:quercetin dioxygenase-like cupin family protein
MVLVIGLLAGCSGMPAAHQDSNGEQVRVVSSYDLPGKSDGNDAAVTMVEVTFGPGQGGESHRHPGPTFVYVIEGTYELGIDDQPTRIYKAGESFTEPAGCLHRVSRNPSTSASTRLIAFIVHPRDAKEILTPADH